MIDGGLISPKQSDAELLRAAALRSLLSNGKRRKIERSTTPTPERLADPNVPLQTPESTSTEQVKQEITPSPLAAPSPSPNPDHEEGEIFEDEEPPIAGPSSFGQSPFRFPSGSALSSPFRQLRDLSTSLDSKLARPGYLDLTEAELRSCKHLILDLLGMGFSSEHLLTIGIHPKLLAICFIEMHLLLPPNLPRDAIPRLPDGTSTPPSLSYQYFGQNSPRLTPDTPRSQARAFYEMDRAPSTLPGSPNHLIDESEWRIPHEDDRHLLYTAPPSIPLKETWERLESPPSSLPLSPNPPSPPASEQPILSSLPPPPPSLPPNPVYTMPPAGPSTPFHLSTPHASLPPKPIAALNPSRQSRPLALATASEAKRKALEEPRLSVEPVDPLPRPTFTPPIPTGSPNALIIDAKEANLKLALRARKARAAAATDGVRQPSEQPLALAVTSRLEELRLRELLLKSRQRGSHTPNRTDDNQSGRDAGSSSPNGTSSLVTSTSSMTQQAAPFLNALPGSSNSLQPVGPPSLSDTPTSGISNPPAFPDTVCQHERKRLRATDLFPDEPSQQADGSHTPISVYQSAAMEDPGKPGPKKRRHSFLQSGGDSSGFRRSATNDWVECIIEVSSDEDDDETPDEDEDTNEVDVPHTALSRDKQAKLDNDVLAFLNGAVFSTPPSQNAQGSLPASTPVTPKGTPQSSESKSAYEKRMADIALLKLMIAKREARRKQNSILSNATDLSTPVSTPPVMTNHASPLSGLLSDTLETDGDGDQIMNDPEAGDTLLYLQSPASLTPSNDLPATGAAELDDTNDENDTLAVIGNSMADSSGLIKLPSELPLNHTQDPHTLSNVQGFQPTNGLSSRFRLYRSPLGMFTAKSSASRTIPFNNTVTMQTGSPIDLLPLKVETASKLNPDRRLCKFETGGGTCLDPKCQDLHIKEFQPNDEDTARFLAVRVPTRKASDIIQALQAVRNRTSNLSYVSLVSEACHTLGLR